MPSPFLLAIRLLPSSMNALFPKHFGTPHEQRPDIPAQKPHILSLHGRHPHQVLRVGEVRIELRQLCVQVGVLAGLVGRGGVCRGHG